MSGQTNKTAASDISVRISDDHMQVFVVIETAKAFDTITPEHVLEQLAEHHVVAGISQQRIKVMLKLKKPKQPNLVASGTLAVHGSDEVIERHHLQEGEEGGDDEHIIAGQILFDVRLATDGKDGFDVFGTVLPAKQGEFSNITCGSGCALNEEETAIIASVGGKLKVEENCVEILAEYVIHGDVDRYVGNIDFPGNVTIHGNVNEGYTITASGNIDIMGLVHSANLTAGGNIHIRQGLLGGNRSVVSAGGDIICDFIENASYVKTGGNIMTHMIIATNVYAEDSVCVKKDGLIIGGKIIAHNRISCKSTSTRSHVLTELVVGMTEDRLQEYRQNQARIIELERESDELQKNLNYLQSMVNVEHPDTDTALLNRIRQYRMLLLRNTSVLKVLRESNEKIRQKINEEARIDISGIIYPLTRININNYLMQIEFSVKCKTFSVKDYMLVMEDLIF